MTSAVPVIALVGPPVGAAAIIAAALEALGVRVLPLTWDDTEVPDVAAALVWPLRDAGAVRVPAEPLQRLLRRMPVVGLLRSSDGQLVGELEAAGVWVISESIQNPELVLVARQTLRRAAGRSQPP